MNNTDYRCPVCGAPLQENASFCLHCMTSFDTKTQIPKGKEPKSKKTRTVIALICVAAVLISAVSVSLFVFSKFKSRPVCTPEAFLERVPLASEKLGVDGLWDASGFKSIRVSPDGKTYEYSTELEFEPGLLSVYFENKGEVLSAVIWDVGADRIDDAKRLLICITDSICDSYYTDIEEVFFNERQYPRIDLGKPFEEYFTDFEKRTDSYNQSIANGGIISTEFLGTVDEDYNIYLYKTERNDGEQAIYDLAVYIEKRK